VRFISPRRIIPNAAHWDIARLLYVIWLSHYSVSHRIGPKTLCCHLDKRGRAETTNLGENASVNKISNLPWEHKHELNFLGIHNQALLIAENTSRKYNTLEPIARLMWLKAFKLDGPVSNSLLLYAFEKEIVFFVYCVFI